MEILCIGGTGTVGSLVVAGLLERGIPVRCLTRSAEEAVARPDRESVPGAPSPDLTRVRGDLAEPSSLEPAFEGVDRVHLLTPLHPEEAALGIAAVRAARREGVERIVFHSVHRVDDAPRVPHFASKLEIFRAIVDSGVPWVTIEPNNYFQNDLWLREAILETGIYPQPLGPIGVSRVDARDIADATVNALLDEGHVGTRYPVAGARAITGPETARIWTEALAGTTGTEIRYVGDDLDLWEAGAGEVMPSWLVHDLRIMWEHFLEHGLVASEEDMALQSHVLGHAPRTFEDFVAETAAAWTRPRGADRGPAQR